VPHGIEVLPFGIVSTPSKQIAWLGSGLPFQASPNSPRFSTRITSGSCK
jgi:hypothetical protein